MTDADQTFTDRAERIDSAQRAVERLDDPARQAATTLASALEEHQASVLRTIVTRLRDDDRGRELLYELVDDAEVYTALAKAGIVRPTLAMRALQVLDGVRPYLTGHNGDVELVRIADGVAHVRLLGACQSCGSATETLRDAVADALLEHLPELEAVQEVPPDAAPTAAFIPVSSLSIRRDGATVS
ncbi:MAG: NifU family protein [Actinomycetota bacterium]